MSENNPYATPVANVSDVQLEEGFGDLKLFTSKGRLGRIRYILYTIAFSLVAMIIAAFLMLIPAVGPFLAMVVYAGIAVVTVFLTIQRCHDFNSSGWWSLLLLVPIVSLVFYFIPGTKAANKYGLQPPPNSKVVTILVFLLIGLVVLGIVAAIALPALVEYTARVTG